MSYAKFERKERRARTDKQHLEEAEELVHNFMWCEIEVVQPICNRIQSVFEVLMWTGKRRNEKQKILNNLKEKSLIYCSLNKEIVKWLTSEIKDLWIIEKKRRKKSV